MAQSTSDDRVAVLKHQFEAQRGIWSPAWESVAKLNPAYLEGYLKIQWASQHRQRLPPKIQEFCYIAVASSVTHIHLPAVEAHVVAALNVGATSQEIFEVLGLSYLLGVHTVTLGFPILQELMEELGIDAAATDEAQQQEKEQIKAKFIATRGFWPETFQPLLDLDPEFFDQYTDFSSFSSRSKVLDPKYREIIITAIDAATTHLYSRGTKIHMRNALKLGATPAEILEMLEITSLMGIDAVSSSAPLLLEKARAHVRGN
ncbi:hypothetical protein Z517_08427 [Fonsecaea pedrosoi CBS 271.37]|uniref:Carboxymuconolactone decarboxylase-like domain-containing protein n=1 Tax=Fonsecaea pedrosoi CBS 271.37 TaxID=1442368 RepID=A0A0D2H1U3_9EURO|nr:uncharacterized protein Z517_08427 [Fonsecaea pedrosoi CBS 271.37]KIW78589.1 hypothetical protein Z517_08427 [Fonsecaea pedrosoi CBS 271.37]